MKKILFLFLFLTAIFFSPYYIPLNLKKALVQRKIEHLPGIFLMENVQIDPFSGLLLEGVTWEYKDTKVLIPSLELNSSLFSLLIQGKSWVIFNNGRVFYKNKLLISNLKSIAAIEFNSEQLSLKEACSINGKIHKEGTEEFTNHTLIPTFSANSFSLDLEKGTISKTGLSSLNIFGNLNLNTLTCEKNKLLKITLALLRQSVSKNMDIECGNISFKILNGIAAFAPTPFIIDHSYDVLSKGTINLISGNLNVLIALTTSSLIKAFDIFDLPEGYLIPFTINGTINNPNIEIKEAAKAIVTLLLLKKIDPESRHYPILTF
jgi:hypothetical protein